MYFFRKVKLISSIIVLSLTIMAATPIIGNAETINTQPPVNLGTTAGFAVLAGSTITNTGPTTVSGIVGANIGLSPGTSFTGQSSMTITTGSSIHIADAVAIKAKNDLIIAYDDAFNRTPVTRIASELGGETLIPGTYDSADGTFEITGTLTLDAKGDPDGVFIFKTASTLKTAVDSNIELINSARFCRIFWQVGSSATLEVNSHFVGHILAFTSITVNSGATIQGQLLARNGAVTLNNNTITNGICETQLPVVDNGNSSNHNNTPTKEDVTPTIPVVEDVTPIIPIVEDVTPIIPIVVEVPTIVPVPKEDTPIIPVEVVIKTVDGGQLPHTATRLYDLLIIGIALTVIGAVIWRRRKHYE